MRTASPEMRRFAQAILALELKEHPAAEAGPLEALRVFARLFPHMATLMGHHGFLALLARALKLAGQEVPWLTTLRLLPTGAWEVPEILPQKITPAQMAEGNQVLVAHLMGLLIALMGEHVTLRQLHTLWSKLSFPAEGGGQPPQKR